MPQWRHPKKAVDRALRYAEEHGWRIQEGGSHAWGRMFCPKNDEDCRCGEFCITSIWSTPRNPESHARQILRVVDGCSALEGAVEDDEGATSAEEED